VAKVSVGIMAIIERAINENVSLVMDGIHIVPVL
jgi:2-phosphoglycerate kinase